MAAVTSKKACVRGVSLQVHACKIQVVHAFVVEDWAQENDPWSRLVAHRTVDRQACTATLHI